MNLRSGQGASQECLRRGKQGKPWEQVLNLGYATDPSASLAKTVDPTDKGELTKQNNYRLP